MLVNDSFSLESRRQLNPLTIRETLPKHGTTCKYVYNCLFIKTKKNLNNYSSPTETFFMYHYHINTNL